MKRQSKLYSALLAVLLFFSLLGCSNEPGIKDFVDSDGKPSFIGIVKEVSDDYITVQVTRGEGIPAGDLLHVTRSIQGKEGTGTYLVGDEVQVIFDGKVATSYPGKILTVYNIIVLVPASL